MEHCSLTDRAHLSSGSHLVYSASNLDVCLDTGDKGSSGYGGVCSCVCSVTITKLHFFGTKNAFSKFVYVFGLKLPRSSFRWITSFAQCSSIACFYPSWIILACRMGRRAGGHGWGNRDQTLINDGRPRGIIDHVHSAFWEVRTACLKSFLFSVITSLTSSLHNGVDVCKRTTTQSHYAESIGPSPKTWRRP